MSKDESGINEHIRTAGFPYPDSVIHTFVGGSALHGAKVSKTDDLDIYGVFIEPPQESLGITRLEHSSGALRATSAEMDQTMSTFAFTLCASGQRWPRKETPLRFISCSSTLMALRIQNEQTLGKRS